MKRHLEVPAASPSPFRWKYPDQKQRLHGPTPHVAEGEAEARWGQRPPAGAAPNAGRGARCPDPRRSPAQRPLGRAVTACVRHLPREAHRITPFTEKTAQGHFPSIGNVPGMLFPSQRTMASFFKFGSWCRRS